MKMNRLETYPEGKYAEEGMSPADFPETIEVWESVIELSSSKCLERTTT